MPETTNSLLHPIDELHFGTYLPADVPAAIGLTGARARERYAAVVKLDPSERTFANTVLGFTRASEDFSAVVGRVRHLSSVVGGWTEADSQVTAAAAELGNEVAFSADLYATLRDFRDDAADTLAPNEQRLLAEIVERYERNGVGLPEKEQSELRDIRQCLSELSAQFKNHAVAASNVAGFLVHDDVELAGMSKPFVERAREAAEDRGTDGYWVAYSQPTYFELMAVCSDARTRQRMYEVQCTLAGDTNGPIATEILSLRQRQAELLGFADYSDLATVERMAGTGSRAVEFLADLTDRYTALTQAEHEELLAFARRDSGDPALELGPSDVDTGMNFYYAGRLYAEKVGFDSQTLREYLPLPQVVETTFWVLNQMYGVTFAETDAPIWHTDVTAYDVFAEDGRKLAVMYADYVARADKRAGAWKNNAYVAPRGAADNGKPYLGYVTFNFTPAEPGEPVLCTLRDAETVLHEIGHLMHEVVSTTTLPEQSGTSCRWDFVEAPSQIMENWFWEPVVLERMAKHFRTGESLPAEVTERLLAARAFRVGASAMRQLYLATVDLELHRSFDGTDIFGFARRVKQGFLPVPVFAGDQFPAMYQHIFAGSYAAGYYSYKWAEVIEAALFDRFRREGVLNPETGRAYARDVLARGSEVEPDELVQAFLGTSATPEAMLRRDGLTA